MHNVHDLVTAPFPDTSLNRYLDNLIRSACSSAAIGLEVTSSFMAHYADSTNVPPETTTRFKGALAILSKMANDTIIYLGVDPRQVLIERDDDITTASALFKNNEDVCVFVSVTVDNAGEDVFHSAAGNLRHPGLMEIKRQFDELGLLTHVFDQLGCEGIAIFKDGLNYSIMFNLGESYE